MITDRFARLEAAVSAERDAVVGHPIYTAIRDLPTLKLFMTSHAFAVWDFMSLLKTLQRRVTSVEVPWLPPSDAAAARLINEMVLGEECDEIAPGRYASHYELYLMAMSEVGLDPHFVVDFVESIRAGASPATALEAAPIPASTRTFVLETLAVCKGATPEVAAAFLLGREALVPSMFTEILAQLNETGLACDSFRLYLDRHVLIDAEQHGPMAKRLLERLCGDDEKNWQLATSAARAALVARRRLWDGIFRAPRA